MTRISTKKFARRSGWLARDSSHERRCRPRDRRRPLRPNAWLKQTSRRVTTCRSSSSFARSSRRSLSLEQQIAALDATAVDVQPLLQRMFDELVAVRGQRCAVLQGRARPAHRRGCASSWRSVDASPSEKFRRLMEAYQIEMEYGRTMSSYKQTLPDGREAEMVRLGRVSLMYRTVEDGETGYWDNERKEFVADPDMAARDRRGACASPKRSERPDLIIVPVPAPQGGRS